MTTERMNLELGVKVETEGTQKLTDLDKILLKLKAAQDQLNSNVGRVVNGPGKAAKEALEIDRDRLRVLKMQMGYQKRERDDAARELRAQQREEERGIERAGRLRAQEHRRAMADARELTRERDRAARQIRQGAGQVRQGVGRTASTGAAIAAASGYAAQRAVDSLTRTAVTIDDAMNQAMIHVYGSQDTKTSQRSAADLRKRLMPVATRLGVRTADMIGATVEAAQAGVEDHLLDVAVEQGTKFAKMNKLNVPDVLEQSGYAFQGLKAFGQVTNETIKKYYDESAYLIATTSANRKELLSFTRTGLASGASVGMNMEETLAFGGAVTAAGGEGQQASRMLSSQGTRIADWRNRGRDIGRKRTRNAEDRQFLDAVQILGFRNSDQMADAFSKDFFGSLVDAQDKLKSISDPLKRKSITGQLFGKEFGALIDSMIMGGNMRDFRQKLDGAGGYLNKSWSKFTTNLGFIIDKIGVVLGNLTDTLSLGLKPLYADLSDWIDRLPASFDGFNSAFRSGIYGFLQGLGSEDGSLSGLLRKALGDPAQFRVDAGAFLRFGRGVGEGIRAVVTSIMSAVRMFTGTNTDPERIGKWAGGFLTLSAALTVAAPAVLIIGAFSTAIMGLARMAAGAWGILARAGVAGAGARVAAGAAVGTGAGAAGAAAGAARVAGWPGIGVMIGAAAVDYMTPRVADFLREKLGPGFLSDSVTSGERTIVGGENFVGSASTWILDLFRSKPAAAVTDGAWQDVGPSKRLEEMRESLEKNTAELKRNTQATVDDARKAAETKAKEAADAEKRKLDSMLVGLRNAGMTGTVGGGGSSAADELRSRGFNPTTPNTTPNGQGNMPQADAGGTRSGGTRSWRNRNPGNLKDGPFARRMGAIGRDGAGFAVFPDEATGRKAQAALLFDNERYKNLSIRQAIARYAPGSDGNDPASYAAQMARAAGVSVDTKLSDLTPAQREKFLDAQRDKEGWRAGTTTGGASASGPLTTDGPVRANLMHGQYGRPGENLGRLVTGNGKSAMVNNAALESFQGFVRELESQGYNIKSLGGFNNRMVRGGNRLSQHAYGNAIDLNPGNNPLGTTITDMPDNVRALAKKYGLIWGMDWKGRKDPMHFEWNGTQPWKQAQRSVEQTREAGANLNKPTTAGRGLGEQGAAPKPVTDNFGNRLGESVPTRSGITNRVPDAALRSPRGGGGSGSVQVHIGQINGGGDPKAIGDEVGRRTREAVNNATHDVDPGGFA